ncbi:frizzled-4-like [Mytilus trossulus]|uniref:frizzled-4-like n=1 Tax=Mytilus trossulus TaxID=6551 RepID=UPI0030042ECE
MNTKLNIEIYFGILMLCYQGNAQWTGANMPGGNMMTGIPQWPGANMMSGNAQQPGGFVMPSGNQIRGIFSAIPQCVPVKSINCEKYGFNSTKFPNYIGHARLAEAENALTQIFTNTVSCPIPKASAEMIGCATMIPLCINGKTVPPCQEDCREVIIKCKVNQIPNFEMAETICSLFPKRGSTSNCISIQNTP